jgi:hypothetical protein
MPNIISRHNIFVGKQNTLFIPTSLISERSKQQHLECSLRRFRHSEQLQVLIRSSVILHSGFWSWPSQLHSSPFPTAAPGRKTPAVTHWNNASQPQVINSVIDGSALMIAIRFAQNSVSGLPIQPLM